MKSKQVTTLLAVFCLYALGGFAQSTPPYALMPVPRQCFWAAGGVPLSGGFIYTYDTGTTNPEKTYSDASGQYPNQNPVNLDSNGCAVIYLGPLSYTISASDSNNVQQWTVNNVSDVGQILYAHAIVNNPPGNALQTIAGPLGADYFQGNTPHTTSPGVRVAWLDPDTFLDTPSNPPQRVTMQPANPNQQYFDPDPGSQTSNYVKSPGPPDWIASTPYITGTVIQPVINNPCFYQFTVSTGGTSGTIEPTWSTTPCASSPATVSDSGVVWASSQAVVQPGNVLDCTKTGITCNRSAYAWLEAASCNNATAALGWDTFGTRSPIPTCLTGTNIQKGVMAMPAAATRVQGNTGSAAASGTATVAYPLATTTGNMLIMSIVVDGSKTVTSVSDGTNSYAKATSITNGAYDLEIWYIYNSTGMAAATNATITLTSGTANIAASWQEYSGLTTTDPLDKTATNTGSGTAVTTGTTAGTAQNIELVFGAVATSGHPTFSITTPGWAQHTAAASGTNDAVDSQGKIQQFTSTQGTTFTLGTSSTWAAAIATFKVNIVGPPQAQRTWGLPPFYISSSPVNATIKWIPQSIPVNNSVTAVVGVAIACTADGSSDDPALNATALSTITIPPGGVTPVATATLNGVTSTGCGPGEVMHLVVLRDRDNLSDVYEGYVYVEGVGLQYGINQ